MHLASALGQPSTSCGVASALLCNLEPWPQSCMLYYTTPPSGHMPQGVWECATHKRAGGWHRGARAGRQSGYMHVQADGDTGAAPARMTWGECRQCSFTLFNSTYCAESLLPADQAALNNCDPARLQVRTRDLPTHSRPRPSCTHAAACLYPLICGSYAAVTSDR